MRVKFFIAMSILTLSAFGQSTDLDFFSINKIKENINILRETSPSNGKYNVYVLVLAKCNTKEESVCYLVSYIFNSNQFMPVLPDGYLNIDDQYVLVRFEDSSCKNLLPSKEILPINGASSVPIVQRLYPSDIGGVHAKNKGIITCVKGGQYKKEVIEDAEMLPKGISLFYKKDFDITQMQPILIDSGKRHTRSDD